MSDHSADLRAVDFEITDLRPRFELHETRRNRRMAALVEALGQPSPTKGGAGSRAHDGPPPALIIVTCWSIRHARSTNGAPPLAYVFETSLGPLFFAPQPGRFADWFSDDDASSADIADQRPDPLSADPRQDKSEPRPGLGFCVLLAEHDLSPLPVKCRDHGNLHIDPVKLHLARGEALAIQAAGPTTHHVRLDQVLGATS